MGRRLRSVAPRRPGAQGHLARRPRGRPAPAVKAVEELFEQLPPRTYDLGPKARGGYALADREARRDLGRKVFALVAREPAAAGRYMHAAHGWLCVKAATEAHEFKLPPALFEDYELVSPEWRPRLLAASAHWLHGRQSPDSGVLQEARREVQKLYGTGPTDRARLSPARVVALFGHIDIDVSDSRTQDPARPPDARLSAVTS